MKPSQRADRPWTLTWVHMVLALAVGAGMPLVWLSWSEPEAAAARPADAARLANPAVPLAQVDAVAVASPPEPAGAAAPPPAAIRTAAAPMIPRQRDPNGDQTPDITDFINQGEVPTMGEVISRLRAAGVQGGLAAFNPPGTRPPLVGIAVGADLELPPGYVRHHQFTDDGQAIEPILMFAPDHPLVVAALQAAQAAQGGGDPAAALRPQDLVVPPALVPPGLPIRHVVVPPPADAGTPGK